MPFPLGINSNGIFWFHNADLLGQSLLELLKCFMVEDQLLKISIHLGLVLLQNAIKYIIKNMK